MKVIFLDIDGVLNYKNYFIEREDREDEIDETKVLLLKEIIDKTGAIIVLSSSWRKLRAGGNRGNSHPSFDKLLGILLKYGIVIYDYTPSLHGNTVRGDEIREWLGLNKVENFIILDDDSDMCEYTETNLVQTSFYKSGLERVHVERAIKGLNELVVK